MAKDSRLHVRIDSDELEKINEAANNEGIKISDYVLEAVRYRLAGGSVDLVGQIQSLNERLRALEKKTA